MMTGPEMKNSIVEDLKEIYDDEEIKFLIESIDTIYELLINSIYEFVKSDEQESESRNFVTEMITGRIEDFLKSQLTAWVLDKFKEIVQQHLGHIFPAGLLNSFINIFTNNADKLIDNLVDKLPDV